MKVKAQWILLLFLIAGFLVPAIAQDSTSVVRRKKNTIRVNLTNPLIFGESFILGYERTIGKHQSISLNAGTYSLPRFDFLRDNLTTSNSTIQIQAGSEDFGMHTSLDYRFYLKRENKYYSPHGVYIGPYVSYNMMRRENTWMLNSASFKGDVITNLNLDIVTGGIQLGYQFLFWHDRLALDMILIGPGISHYQLKLNFDSTLEVDDKKELIEAINDALEERFPGYALVIDDAEFKRSGTANTTSMGYRYVLHFGFRF